MQTVSLFHIIYYVNKIHITRSTLHCLTHYTRKSSYCYAKHPSYIKQETLYKFYQVLRLALINRIARFRGYLKSGLIIRVYYQFLLPQTDIYSTPMFLSIPFYVTKYVLCYLVRIDQTFLASNHIILYK